MLAGQSRSTRMKYMTFDKINLKYKQTLAFPIYNEYALMLHVHLC